MEERCMKIIMTVLFALLIAAIPVSSFATDSDIVERVSGYTLESGETIPLYRVRIPSDTEEIELSFDDTVVPVTTAGTAYCDTERGTYDA